MGRFSAERTTNHEFVFWDVFLENVLHEPGKGYGATKRLFAVSTINRDRPAVPVSMGLGRSHSLARTDPQILLRLWDHSDGNHDGSMGIA